MATSESQVNLKSPKIIRTFHGINGFISHTADLVDGTFESMYATSISLGCSLIGAELAPTRIQFGDNISASTKPIE